MMKFKEMLCPICGKYYFTDDSQDEKNELDYKGKLIDYCSECGWIYDLGQTENPDLKDGENELSLNEYKLWYQNQLEIDPNYNYTEATYKPTPHLCPVCGQYEFKDKNSFDVCPVCGWIDDDVMESEPDDWAECSNDLCLNDYRKRYINHKNK